MEYTSIIYRIYIYVYDIVSYFKIKIIIYLTTYKEKPYSRVDHDHPVCIMF